jgi:AbrB family looped-hinge helix DNA binding protein
MEAKVDSVGRVLIPKKLREALGLRAGSTVDISWYGSGLQIVPHGRTARIVREHGRLVATSDTPINDEIMYALIDAGRR